MPEEKEIEITLKWQNQNYFEMTAKLDGEESKIIVKLEEDGRLEDLWKHIDAVAKDYFNAIIKDIGKEMKE